MYLIVASRDYKKSFAKLKASGKLKRQALDSLEEAVNTIANGKKLPPGYQDHQLSGELKRYRECHIKGDLRLQYQLHKQELILVLIDIGTHSALF
ncbi:hypothetical protein A2671_01105 [Candidatus Kaiserbacteria bacterium RIFCSPHIGHO2_01_FULL_49_13]|uniref:Addiction module toxin RelE n=1 Tax=Candidatus Kaiserbacteria bacterium RIFCSPHIGHO2_01_FULL_49_13 TaxID=1798477 RepID=A0A1F6CDW8_9BACT|nr:MAG: hypothetical protein A2671_01105 [Candidatus Kaiserbacteria bacterium RIFCSPHIGHO2_01_FULL_49_13]